MAERIVAKETLTAERLRELLDYDPQTGVFRWKVDRMCGRYYKQFAARAGQVAANTASDGRVQLRIDGKNYRGHRLAWLYVYGVWPIREIDHIDGNASNNAIDNLRHVDRFTNMQNRTRPRAKSASGLIGVTLRKTKKGPRFIAQLCINTKTTYLGMFKTADEAHSVYLAEKRKYHKGCTI